MAIEKTRKTIHKLVDNIHDEAVLKLYLKLLEREAAKSENDFWESLHPEERAGIEEGLAQAERGELIPHEEVWAEMKRKFNI